MPLAVKRARKLTVLARVVTLLWGYRLALWLLPFRWVTRWARWAERPTTLREPAELERWRVTRKVERAAAFVPHATCLVRVLAGAHLFAAQGQRAEVVIGVRKRAGTLEAHAWLEAGGQIVLGNLQDLASYHPLH